MSDPTPASLVVEAAKQFLAGEIGLIDCAIRIKPSAPSLVPEWESDPDFLFFCGIAIHTAHLPGASARQYWSADALKDADAEIAEIEAETREEAQRAGLSLIERFRPSSP